VAARTLGNDLDDVVVLDLRPVGARRHEVEYRAVEDALLGQRGGRPQRGAVRAAKEPPAVARTLVGEPVAGTPQQLG
jgi:hypothetical protein